MSILEEEGVGSVGLENGSGRLLDARRERELDLAVIDLLNPQDLNGVSSGAMTGSHVPVALGDGIADVHVAVLAVHVVSARPGVVPQPNAKVLDGHWLLLELALNAGDLAISLLDLPQLAQKVPVPGFGDDMIGSEDPHLVELRSWV